MEKKKRGRPFKNAVDGRRNRQVNCCFTDKEYELLTYLSERTRLSKVDVIVTGLNIYKNLVVDKH